MEDLSQEDVRRLTGMPTKRLTNIRVRITKKLNVTGRNAYHSAPL